MSRIRSYQGWFAGIAVADITPASPLVLGGYGVTFPFTRIDAPLRAKALALQWSDDEPVVIVSVDTLKLREVSIGPVRRRLCEQLQLDESRLIFVATHTHEAPMLPGHFGHSEPFLETFLDPENLHKRSTYLATLQESLVALCLEAVTAMAPVALELGRSSTDFAVNRRVRLPDGSVGIGENRAARVDHEVPSLIVRNLDGCIRGLVFGYACHGTTVQPQIVSPDYMGYAEIELERRFSGCIALFLPGFGGDVNPSPWSRDVAPYPASDGGVANARGHGMKLADAVTSVAQAGGDVVAGPLVLRTSRVDPALAPPPTQSELARELESATDDVIFGPRRIARARAYLDMQSRGQQLPTSISLPLSYLDLGSHAFLFMAGEVVSEYALQLKALVRKPLWTVGYSMDCPAYIPSARMIEEGGYEPRGSMVNNGWFGPFDVGVERTVTEGVLQLARGNTG